MDTSGLEISDYAGLHDDGWCEPHVRLRVTLDCHATEIRVGMWLKPEEGHPGVIICRLTHDDRRPVTRAVQLGIPTEVALPVDLGPGAELSFHIHCDHRVGDRAGDARDLSFKMTSLVAL